MSEQLYPAIDPSLPPYKVQLVLLDPPDACLPHQPIPIATLLPQAATSVFSSPLPQGIPYPASPPFAVRPTPGRVHGLGMYAVRKISAGELILEEHPVLIVPERPLPHDSGAWDALGDILPERERQEMLSLAQCRGRAECPSRVEDVVRTNALILDLNLSKIAGSERRKKRKAELDLEQGQERYGGVFLKINRCNHSCGPNAAHKWSSTTLSTKLYALRDIQPDEEITIFYTDVTQPRAVRRAELQRNHRFLCACLHCSPLTPSPTTSPTEEHGLIDASDTNRHLLRQWLSTNPSFLKWCTDICRPDDVVISSHLAALRLIYQENLHFLQYIFLEELALCYAILGDESFFKFWAEQFIAKCGIEDEERAKEFKKWIEEPRTYKKWGWRQRQRALQTKRTSSPVYDYSPLML